MCSSTVYSLRPAKEVILAFEIYPTKKVILGEVGPVLNHAFIGLCMHARGDLPTAHNHSLYSVIVWLLNTNLS